jgi:hypothetical protein
VKPDDPRAPRPVAADLGAPGLPGTAAIGEQPIAPEYWRSFSIVAFAMNRFVIDQVIRAARHFDNDIEAMVIFGMLSHLNVAHLVPPGASPSADLTTKGSVPDSQPRMRPVRLRDLEQITGRPRETIRRKLERLEADGRVIRGVDGYVLRVDAVTDSMRLLTMDSARRFMESARVIDGALRDAAAALEREGGRDRNGGAGTTGA